MDTAAKKDVSEAAPKADAVTQIQIHIALICARFYNFIGALQRDAPPAPLHGEAIPDQRHVHLEVGLVVPNCHRRRKLIFYFIALVLQNEIKVMRKEVNESLTSLESLIQQLPDLSSVPESRQWQEAAELEAADEREAATLEKKLQEAKQNLNLLYNAHGSLADASLPH